MSWSRPPRGRPLDWSRRSPRPSPCSVTSPSTDHALDPAELVMVEAPPATPLDWSRRVPRPSPCPVTNPSTRPRWWRSRPPPVDALVEALD